ncbi:hypothetical protein Fmac_006150 [Flemingia macrophylla]|uniref:Uncharacterized protein n=1 Tax=Flemingia macrophylla TaxID=520843 RepID=A0ABD1N9W1_9FABA
MVETMMIMKFHGSRFSRPGGPSQRGSQVAQVSTKAGWPKSSIVPWRRPRTDEAKLLLDSSRDLLESSLLGLRERKRQERKNDLLESSPLGFERKEPQVKNRERTAYNEIWLYDGLPNTADHIRRVLYVSCDVGGTFQLRPGGKHGWGVQRDDLEHCSLQWGGYNDRHASFFAYYKGDDPQDMHIDEIIHKTSEDKTELLCEMKQKQCKLGYIDFSDPSHKNSVVKRA